MIINLQPTPIFYIILEPIKTAIINLLPQTMNQSSDHSSFCSICHKERIVHSKHELNNLLSPDLYTYKTKDLKDAETRFQKLQEEILHLKQQNQKKLQTIEHLKTQVHPKPRKSSLDMQIQDNRKSFEQLKNSLISFGNTGFPEQKNPKQVQTRVSGSVSTELIINSLQKRLKQYKIELLKLIEKVELHEKSTEWMYQFIESFLKMVLEINKTGRFGEPLVLKELSIKKRTKIAWKYLKDILEEILNP